MEKRQWAGYAFVAPGVILLILILGFPAVMAVLQSLGIGEASGPSLAGYARLVQDAEFRASLLNTVIFVVCVVSLHFLLGLGVALLLNQRFRGRWLFRVIAILPWTMPDVIGGLIFRFIFDTLSGGVNLVIQLAGGTPVDWLGHPQWSLMTVILAEAWRGYPYVMLILLAGLQAIPRDQYEAAEIDGVGKWKVFAHITLPNLRPMIAIALILDAIWECRLFGMIYGMTGGGPGYATQNLTLLVYKNYFQFFDSAYASSIAVVLAALLLVLAVPYVRTTLKEQR
ncbi:carbohydrate ABC transporter permease [Bordetella hinzii]|uniref:Sugar ABC transporter permease n=2 Tax=Bordetella hinzii TaxID=103855 RepID=A0AAN1RZ23_9BORD|nr:sugar ABC transporter permease [Bordetella hinzii]AKQ55766.1 Lactose transport system permease protein LacF [Bordetella hinzii]AKQ60299.1 Lactose transport system permease protein LacF [Bordetella hinzii]AZW18633.1 sugar ABC transporter permease [Bordetella hinzii]KCB25308.1 ABC transporter, permease protein [Bordetella hinzii OH87 BAL007II]KCB31496.1 ABC transporter, permease protein [Bordetella hinzii L60]